MLLIADCGSTKCTWCFVNQEGKTTEVTTTGMNPVVQSPEEIARVIEKELGEEMTRHGLAPENTTRIYFYGAGCTPQKKGVIQMALEQYFPTAKAEVESDMLGAARALCQKETGIACILGTGANSCLYQDGEIVEKATCLGFILGDEGSGAYLGKKLLHAIFKRQLSEDLIREFQEIYPVQLHEVIDHVYRQPAPNRYLASFTPFLSLHKDKKEIQEIIKNAFNDFIFYNVEPYQKKGVPVSLVGSIAYYFQNELKECIENKELALGQILRYPMEGLIRYHWQEMLK